MDSTRGTRTGQGGAAAPTSHSDARGYIMVALLIGLAVTAVWMGALLPAWRHQTTREKEAELIFRGEAYARAIALFFVKNQTLPPNLDVLVQQRYLRRKYTDPITGKDFLPLGSAQGFAVAPGQTGRLGQPGTGARGQTPAPGQGVAVAPVSGFSGIFGVRSTSTATSIIVYQGQTTHSQFPFDYQVALQRIGARAGAGPAITAPGRGGRGGELAPVAPLRGGRGFGGNAPGPRGAAPARGTAPPPVFGAPSPGPADQSGGRAGGRG
ncbi:MAG: hypothetical protein IT184_03435 [Acidobacteria bacterium]|nr:hypothetical protein [Acidobacteriota bacterium]